MEALSPNKWGNSQENVFVACDESVHLWWLERDISHSHLIVATTLFSSLKIIVAEREIPIWLQYYSHKHVVRHGLMLI